MGEICQIFKWPVVPACALFPKLDDDVFLQRCLPHGVSILSVANLSFCSSCYCSFYINRKAIQTFIFWSVLKQFWPRMCMIINPRVFTVRRPLFDPIRSGILTAPCYLYPASSRTDPVIRVDLRTSSTLALLRRARKQKLDLFSSQLAQYIWIDPPRAPD